MTGKLPISAPEEKAILFFKIAGLAMEVSLPSKWAWTVYLPSFANFKVDAIDENICVKVTVQEGVSTYTKDRWLLSDQSNVWGDRFRFEESTDFYITSVKSVNRDGEWRMYSSKDFRNSRVYVPPLHEGELATVLSWLLMIAYGQGVLEFDALLLHASVVVKEGRGFVFLGKSGTGKSTHSRLWQKYLPEVTLLNDDNPVVRMEETGTVHVYGTPWSGKTPCYLNEGVPLVGIARLQQEPENKWFSLSGVDALVAVLPSTTAIRWNTQLYEQMVDHLEVVVEKVRVGLLECLPDEEAAWLCYRNLKNINNTLENE